MSRLCLQDKLGEQDRECLCLRMEVSCGKYESADEKLLTPFRPRIVAALREMESRGVACSSKTAARTAIGHGTGKRLSFLMRRPTETG